MLSFIKHFVGVLAMPAAFAGCLALLALGLRLLGRRRGAAWLFGLAGVLIYLLSIEPVANLLTAPLERRYPPLDERIQISSFGYIVVLGADYQPREGIPVTAALEDDGLTRITEGLRLARRNAAAHLVVSGGAPHGLPAPAQGYARLARDFGVVEPLLIVSDGPLDTGAEARATARLLGQTPFLLVTSAYHMPRAMWLMSRAGTRPVAAPTGQRVTGICASVLRCVLPSSRGLRMSERALHEYMGLTALASGYD